MRRGRRSTAEAAQQDLQVASQFVAFRQAALWRDAIDDLRQQLRETRRRFDFAQARMACGTAASPSAPKTWLIASGAIE